ncbi:ankyrin repeat domain-containing protein 26-like isoform X2 [Dipodomys merriami]|uniref:ankyrin repeat domain-containing protein 26-like isoform X2 n=1 Tax=Dipodomys merriami TaxID=94247 RepID=UPI00385604F7
MNECDDFSLSSEISSECCEVSDPNYDDILVLLEQLRIKYNDPGRILKIQDTFHSYKRLLKLKCSHYEALKGKTEQMKENISTLQKELSEEEHAKAEQEQELRNLRFALKQEEEKRRNIDGLYEKIKVQLRDKEEQYKNVVKRRQKLDISVRTLGMELKTVKNDLSQAIQERNDIRRKLSEEQSARILQDEIVENNLSKQKEMEMSKEKMSAELQELQDLHKSNEQYAEMMQKLTQKLELKILTLKSTVKEGKEQIEQMKKVSANENLNTGLVEKMEIESLKYGHLHQENEFLRRELLSMTSVQKKCKTLQKDKKKLEEEIVNLKSHMEKNMVDLDQMEKYKQTIKDETKQELEEKLINKQHVRKR